MSVGVINPTVFARVILNLFRLRQCRCPVTRFWIESLDQECDRETQVPKGELSVESRWSLMENG